MMGGFGGDSSPPAPGHAASPFSRAGGKLRPTQSEGGLQQSVAGWKEYADLPELGLYGLKVKMDTGARTSALHVASFEVDGDRVHMTLLRHRRDETVAAVAPLAGWLEVRNSGGELVARPVIRTLVRVGQAEDLVRVTLADRGGMLFRMLVGRKAIEALGFAIDPARKYVLGRPE